VPPAPVFTPNAVVTLADGSVMEVADFAFYSEHRSFEGGFYTPDSGEEDWPLRVKIGPIWKLRPFSKIKSIEFSRNEDPDWLSVKVSFLDGTAIAGEHPAYGFVAWFAHGGFYLLGESEVLGRTGAFKCEWGKVTRVEKIAPAGGAEKFRVMHKDEPEGPPMTSDVTNPSLRLIWKNDTPSYVDTFTVEDDMPLQVQGTEIKIKPKEIDSVAPIPRRTDAFIIKMKKGEVVKAGLPARYLGKLANGDILFSTFFKDDQPTIKSIVNK